MFLVVSVGLIAVVASTSPGARLLVLPILAATFAKAFSNNPKHGLALLLVMTGFPIYIQFGGRDAMVLSTALVCVAYLTAGVRRLLRRVPFAGWPVLLLVGIYSLGTAGLWGSAEWASSARMLLGVLAAVMLGHLVYSTLRDQPSLDVYLSAWALLLILQAGIAVVQVTSPTLSSGLLQAFASRTGDTGAIVAGGIGRATGAVGDYELLSEWFAGAAPVFLALLVSATRRRWLWAIALTSCGAGIVVTVSRGGVVAVIVGLAVFVMLLTIKRTALAGRVLTIGGSALMALVLFLVLALPASLDAVATRFGLTATAYQRSGSVERTLNRGWAALPPEATQATLLGNGIFRLDVGGIAWWGSPHSLALALWYQVGVLGCVAFLWLIGGYLVAYISAMRLASSRPLLLILSAAAFAGFVATMASEVVVEMVRYAHTTQYFAAFFAFGLSVFAMYKKSAVPQ